MRRHWSAKALPQSSGDSPVARRRVVPPGVGRGTAPGLVARRHPLGEDYLTRLLIRPSDRALPTPARTDASDNGMPDLTSGRGCVAGS